MATRPAVQIPGTGVDLVGLDQERRRLLLENKRLRRDLARQRRHLTEVQNELRRKLARDLHDGLAQSVATLALHLDYLKRLAERNGDRVAPELDTAREQAVAISRDVRNLLFELRPLILESHGLVPALESLVARVGRGIYLEGSVSSEGTPVPLPTDIELAAFAIVQEAIGNIRKHACAKTFRVELEWHPECLFIRVRDDGRGFDADEVERDYRARGSYGLLSMRERAELIGAQLRVASAAGAGTVVELELSLPVTSSSADTAR